MVDDWTFGADEKTGLVWLRDTEENAKWYEALLAIDKRGDKKPLIELLKSGQAVPATIAHFVGDLLERYELRQRQARPRVPAYARTKEQIKLTAAVIELYEMTHVDEVDFDSALEKVAAESGQAEETLRSAYLGQHGGLRRVMRRWYRP